MSMDDDRRRIDSRRWTGRGLRPAHADRKAAWQAFRSAAGPGGVAPRRAAAIVCALGGVLVPLAIVAIAPDAPHAIRLHALLAQAIGSDGARHRLSWLAAFVGPALLIALAASLTGAVSAWRNRHALARGFAAVPVARLESGGADVALALGAFGYLSRSAAAASTELILALWMLAYFLARGMTLMSERLCAPNGSQPWKAARMALAAGAIIMLLAASAYR